MQPVVAPDGGAVRLGRFQVIYTPPPSPPHKHTKALYRIILFCLQYNAEVVILFLQNIIQNGILFVLVTAFMVLLYQMPFLT